MGSPNSHEVGVFCAGYLRCLLSDLYEALNSLLDQLPESEILKSHEHLLSRPRLLLELERDEEYLLRRVRSEGVGFLTVALPSLDKRLLKYFEEEVWDPPKGFKPYTVIEILSYRKIVRYQVPMFLHVTWLVVLSLTSEYGIQLYGEDRETMTALGALIRRLRCMFLAFYKLDLPYSEEKVSLAFQNFISNEEALVDQQFPADNRVLERSEHVLSSMFSGFDLDQSSKTSLDLPLQWTPRHGPGAVAGGQKGDEKWTFTTLYESLHRVFPYYFYMYGIRSGGRALHLAANAKLYRELRHELYPTAKLVAVPKDSRGPRLISEEPCEIQYMQQAIARPLMDFLERESEVSRGQINFADQSINGYAALKSSSDREFATIDLKDASDRVSLSLFRRVFPSYLHRYFEALRSHATKLPSGELIMLRKFAPMGSALCFPVESAIFYAIAVASLIERCDLTLESASRSVFVYGDDIIVPSKHAHLVMNDLESVGLLVNKSKSFITGFFRESCGIDAWHGQVVTPVKLKKNPVIDVCQGESVLAYASYADSLLEIGCRRASHYIEMHITASVGRLPITDIRRDYVSYVRPKSAWKLNEYPRLQWDSGLQQWTSLLLCAKVKRTETSLTGWERLARGLLMPARDSSPDWQTVRGAVSLRRRRVIVEAERVESPA